MNCDLTSNQVSILLSGRLRLGGQLRPTGYRNELKLCMLKYTRAYENHCQT